MSSKGKSIHQRLPIVPIKQARSHDYHHLLAKIWADTDISMTLHRKFGYEMVGVQKDVGFVDGEWQDVAIMQKLLED